MTLTWPIKNSGQLLQVCMELQLSKVDPWLRTRHHCSFRTRRLDQRRDPAQRKHQPEPSSMTLGDIPCFVKQARPESSALRATSPSRGTGNCDPPLLCIRGELVRDLASSSSVQATISWIYIVLHEDQVGVFAIFGRNQNLKLGNQPCTYHERAV